MLRVMARHAIAIALAIATTATATTTANAQVPTDVARGQLAAPTDVIRSEAVSRRRANGYATLDVSRIGDQPDFDLYCPHSVEPSPLVVIVPDARQRRIEVAGVASMLASHAFVVVVVDAAPAPRVGALIAKLVAAHELDAREPGCTLAPGIALLGIGDAATVALEAARHDGVAAVVAAYASARPPDPNVPLLAISVIATAAQYQLVVADGDVCDFDDDACHGVPGVDPARSVMAGHDRLTEVLSRTATWLHAIVEHDPESVAKLQRWDPSVVVDDQWTERYVHSKHTFVSLPITLGFTTAGDNGFAYGVRPQLVRASLVEGTRRDKQRQGFGIGGYAALSRANGSALVGGGVMLARYYAPLALSPALGVYHRSDEMASATGLAVSMSTGFRNFIDLDHFDFPHDLRIEGHIGLGATKERSVTITLELDTALMVSAITAALVGLGSIGS